MLNKLFGPKYIPSPFCNVRAGSKGDLLNREFTYEELECVLYILLSLHRGKDEFLSSKINDVARVLSYRHIVFKEAFVFTQLYDHMKYRNIENKLYKSIGKSVRLGNVLSQYGICNYVLFVALLLSDDTHPAVAQTHSICLELIEYFKTNSVSDIAVSSILKAPFGNY